MGSNDTLCDTIFFGHHETRNEFSPVKALEVTIIHAERECPLIKIPSKRHHKADSNNMILCIKNIVDIHSLIAHMNPVKGNRR